MIHFCGVIFYAIFASGELQPWAEPMAIAGAAGVIPGQPGVPGVTAIPPATGMVDPNAQWATGNNPFGQPNGTMATTYGQQPAGYTAVTTNDPYTAASWNDPTATDAYGQSRPY